MHIDACRDRFEALYPEKLTSTDQEEDRGGAAAAAGGSTSTTGSSSSAPAAAATSTTSVAVAGARRHRMTEKTQQGLEHVSSKKVRQAMSAAGFDENVVLDENEKEVKRALDKRKQPEHVDDDMGNQEEEQEMEISHFVIEKVNEICGLSEIEESTKAQIIEEFKDHTWWHDAKYDMDKIGKSRTDEVIRLTRYDAFTEIEEDKYDGEVIDTRWVGARKDEEYRSRIAARGYNDGAEDGLFAGTPDLVVLRLFLHILASDPKMAAMVIDAESAFLQPRLKEGERLVILPPKDIRKKGIMRDMHVPIYGWRKASVSWQDHVADEQIDMEFRRSELEPLLFMNDSLGTALTKAIEDMTEKEINAKSVREMIHGDDTFCIGYRETLAKHAENTKSRIVCKVGQIVSLHEDDAKELKFLKRSIRVNMQGWGYEADQKHAGNLIARFNLEDDNAKSASTPGVNPTDEETLFENEEERDELDPPMTQTDATEHRGGAGQGQLLAGDRLDLKSPVKEAMRDNAKPRASSHGKMKRVARYLKHYPRCLNCYRWQVPKKGDGPRRLAGGVDCDHAGCKRTRKSTTCIVGRIGRHVVQEQSVTQPGLPALSSGECEYRGLVKCAVEMIYVQNLLRFLRIDSRIELETDSSGQQAGCGEEVAPCGGAGVLLPRAGEAGDHQDQEGARGGARGRHRHQVLGQPPADEAPEDG